jgi:very-short-patch-repair endonuclease
VGIIEVDGLSHNLKRESDKSRDRLLENAGFAYIDRFDARECEDPDKVRQLVERFLSRLRGVV